MGIQLKELRNTMNFFSEKFGKLFYFDKEVRKKPCAIALEHDFRLLVNQSGAYNQSPKVEC